MERKKLPVEMDNLTTVVTVVFNAADCIEETIKSVLGQRYSNIEYIIIDGGSTDGTVDILKKYEGKFSYWLSEKDSGIYDAMNKAIALAKGCWLNFMNAGDTFSSDKSVANFIQYSDKDRSLIYSNILINRNRNRNRNRKENKLPLYQRGLFQYGLIKNICHQSVFYNVNKLKAVLFFDTQYQIAADLDLLLRIFFYDEENFAVKNEHYDVSYLDGGVSSINRKLRLVERGQIFKQRLKNKPFSYYLNFLNLLRIKYL